VKLALALFVALQAPAPAPKAAPAAPAAAARPAPKPAAKPAPAVPARPAEGEGVSTTVFENGVALYESGDHRGAAAKLWEYVSGNEPVADQYEWAELYLAKSFRALGMRHAAVEYFYNVAKERKAPSLLPEALRALEEIGNEGPYDQDLVQLDLLAGTEFGALPPDAKAFVEYTQGRIDLRDGRLPWADRHFQLLAASGADDARVARYALRAKYAGALHALRETRGKEGKGAKERRDAAIAELQAVVGQKDGDVDTVNDAKRTLAEVLFEEKRWPDALKVYESIRAPFLSQEEATLFLEKAWTRYYLGDPRGTLGILLTLDAPSYRSTFRPERYVLKALAYKSLCHYAAAKASAREFLRTYGASLQQLRRSRDPMSDPFVRGAAVDGKRPKRMLAFLRGLQREREMVDSLSNEKGLATHLARIYDLKIAEVVRKLERAVEDEAVAVAGELLDYEEQARLVDYEVSLEVFRRLKKGSGKQVVDEEPPIPLGSRDVYYPFDGEYWNDELHDYRFRIENRCFGGELFE
jgi:hypothetical protein